MTVEWDEHALDQLADILVRVGSLAAQDAIERTVLRVRAALAADPMDLGESRGGDADRVWFIHPLVVRFRIEADRDNVLVTHVAHLGPRGS